VEGWMDGGMDGKYNWLYCGICGRVEMRWVRGVGRGVRGRNMWQVRKRSVGRRIFRV
jgi:hypothetical protein